MLYQCALHTTVPQCIWHKNPHTATKYYQLDECATLSTTHHNHRGCRQKASLFAGQTVSIISNDRTLWLPATVVYSADHCSYIVQVIGGGQYRCACYHIHEHHPDAIKPGVHTTMDVAPATLPAPVTRAVHNPSPPPPFAPTTPQPTAAARAPAANHTLRRTPATVHTPQGAQQPAVVQKQTGATQIALHQSARNSKPPNQLIEEM